MRTHLPKVRLVDRWSVCLCLLLGFLSSRAAAQDTIFENGFESASTQIALLRALPDGPVSVAIPAALVTYLKPAIGSDPAGFFIQGDPSGPAVFIAVDPATTSPSAQAGDRINLTVTTLTTLSGLRAVTAIANYSRAATGQSLAGLVQDLSTASDIVTALDGYESELMAIFGTITSAFSGSGSGFVAAALNTAGSIGDSQLKMRVPATLASALSLAQGCSFTVGPIPMWRFTSVSEPSPNTADDFVALECPAPRVLDAVALSATSVRVRFDRSIDPVSVAPNGSQFAFDNGLFAASALVSGVDVIVGTSAQTPKTGYTVTVAISVTDTLGTPLDGTAASASFQGFQVPATLLLNEIAPNITASHDLVELRAISAGSTSGIALVQDPGSNDTVLALMPDITVANGDLIVIHLVPVAGVVDETSSKSGCVDASCYAAAWDVRGGNTGITFSDRTLAVIDATGAITDAVAFARPSSADSASFPVSVRYIQALGTWLPVDCGGSPCDYVTTPTVLAISVDWSGASSTTASSTVQRKPGSDSNSAADWIVAAQTLGASN